MKPMKPYDPVKQAKQPRSYRRDLTVAEDLDMRGRTSGLLLLTVIPAAVMAIVLILLKFPWFTVRMMAICTAMVALSIAMVYIFKRGYDRYSATANAGEYVPEWTQKVLKRSKTQVRLATIMPVLYAAIVVVMLCFGRREWDGASTTWFNFMIQPILWMSLTNGEISAPVFMADGFYTGTPGDFRRFVPYAIIDDVTFEEGRSTSRGVIMKMKFFSGGEQIGHDRMYRAELDEVLRRMRAVHS